MPDPDTTESREPELPMLEQARLSLTAANKLALPNPNDEYRRGLIADAQVEATLAVAEEIRALREQFTPAGGGTIGEQAGFALDRATTAIVDMTHNISEEAVRHRA